MSKIFVELDEKEYELFKEIQKITCTDYELKGNLVDKEGMICALEELVYEVHRLEEEIGNLEADMRDNYKPIELKDQYEVYDRDFI